ncbi:MAG TPA: outer membrane lipoprotein chaperone LolA [Candidatus Sulfotelmatobacter sp.]|nr:outer membrane lipoprotein chaperone LolA [Candidatus Sulfotelmatobacter sp.]
MRAGGCAPAPAAARAAGMLVVALFMAALPAPRAAAAAPGGQLDEVVDRLERTYAAARDLTARFRQTSTITAAAQVQQASGTVAVKRPGKMRWEYAEPDPRLFVTDGTTFWAYSPEDKQVLVRETKGALGATPLAFLMGAGNLRQDFQIREVAHAAGGGKTALLDLRPVKPNATLARLLLEVDLASSLIVQATVFDAVGNTIVLALSDQRLNTGVPDSRFTFVPPPGVQVVTGAGARP